MPRRRRRRCAAARWSRAGDAAPAALEGAGIVGRARAAARRSPAPCIPRRAPARWRRAWRAASTGAAPRPSRRRRARRAAACGVVAMCFGPGAVQAAQRVARRAEVALLQRELGAAHQARRLQRLARAVGALEPAVAALEVAHLVRGARREQRRHARRRPALERDRGLLLGARIAPFVVGLQRGGERGVGALAAAARAEGAHVGRQRERVRRAAGAARRAAANAGQQRDGEEQHRHLDAPRRIDEQHVARVDAPEDHQRHGRGEHREQPEQRFHPGRALAARLEAAHRLEALGDGRHLEADRGRRELLQLRRARPTVCLRARIEVAPDPGLRGAQVLAVARLVAREQREARVEQAQPQVLAQEVRLRRRQQRRLRRVHLPHHHQLAQLAPHLGAQARPEAAASAAGGVLRRRPGARRAPRRRAAARRPPATRLSRRMLMPAMSIAGSAFRRSMSRASARRDRHELRPVGARQARLGELQREQRGAHVAGELQLLRGDGEHLLDLGELPFVAVARQLLVQRLERELLALRLGEPRLELRRSCRARRAAPPAPARAIERASRASASMSRSRRASSSWVALDALAHVEPEQRGERRRRAAIGEQQRARARGAMLPAASAVASAFGHRSLKVCHQRARAFHRRPARRRAPARAGRRASLGDALCGTNSGSRAQQLGVEHREQVVEALRGRHGDGVQPRRASRPRRAAPGRCAAAPAGSTRRIRPSRRGRAACRRAARARPRRGRSRCAGRRPRRSSGSASSASLSAPLLGREHAGDAVPLELAPRARADARRPAAARPAPRRCLQRLRAPRSG